MSEGSMGWSGMPSDFICDLLVIWGGAINLWVGTSSDSSEYKAAASDVRRGQRIDRYKPTDITA